MTKLKQLWLLTALASIAALAGGYFLLVSPKASKAEALRQETATVEEQNKSLKTQIEMLQRQKKDLPRQQAELERFAKKIPNNPALPALIRALSDAADNSGVSLESMAPGVPVAVGAPAAAVTPTAATAASASAVPTSIPLASIPISLKVVGDYSEVSQFFSEIERLPRAFLVNGFTITRGGETVGPAGALPGGASLNTRALSVQLKGTLYMQTKPPAAPRPQPAATTVVN